MGHCAGKPGDQAGVELARSAEQAPGPRARPRFARRPKRATPVWRWIAALAVVAGALLTTIGNADANAPALKFVVLSDSHFDATLYEDQENFGVVLTDIATVANTKDAPLHYIVVLGDMVNRGEDQETRLRSWLQLVTSRLCDASKVGWAPPRLLVTRGNHQMALDDRSWRQVLDAYAGYMAAMPASAGPLSYLYTVPSASNKAGDEYSFVMLDTGGAKSGSGRDPVFDAAWFSAPDILSNVKRNGHAFFFGHAPLFVGGSAPTNKPPRDAIKNGGVLLSKMFEVGSHYYFSGHEHFHTVVPITKSGGGYEILQYVNLPSGNREQRTWTGQLYSNEPISGWVQPTTARENVNDSFGYTIVSVVNDKVSTRVRSLKKAPCACEGAFHDASVSHGDRFPVCGSSRSWEPSEPWDAYAVGDYRMHHGRLYRCIAPAFAQGYPPGTVAGEVAWVSEPGCCQPISCGAVGHWSSSDPWSSYAAGDLRWHGGRLYQVVDSRWASSPPDSPYGKLGWAASSGCSAP